MLIAGLLEFPCNRSGIYEVFAMISIALLCLFPFVTTGINATSIAFHILALRQNESKVKNIVMMAISILYDVVIIAFFICFFRGLWGYSGIFFVNTCQKSTFFNRRMSIFISSRLTVHSSLNFRIDFWIVTSYGEYWLELLLEGGYTD